MWLSAVWRVARPPSRKLERAPAGGSEDAVPASPRGVRRWLRRLLLGLVAVALTTLGFAAADAWAVARELRAGRAALSDIVERDAFSGDLKTNAREAATHVEDAVRRANRSPWLKVWSRVPLLGRQASWVRDAAGGADAITAAAVAAADRIAPALERVGDGPSRLALLETVDQELAKLRAVARSVRLDGGWLLPPMRGANRELERNLTRLRVALDNGIAAVRGVKSFLKGPGTYLVLAANNAEMRAGGMVLQAGTIRTDGGRILPGPFRSTADLFLSEGVSVPREMASLYGWLDPGREWRNTGTSPNFPVTAGIYAAMAERAGFGRVDGVLQIDVVALKHVLEAIGPVRVGGVGYRSDNVERLVMHDLYVAFGEEHEGRRLGFSALAVETFRSLERGGWKAADLISSLRDATAGRHLLAWSRDPDENEGWERLHLDGSLDPDGLMFAVQNHAGNKLDWFLRPEATIAVEPRPDGWRHLNVRLDIANRTPPGQPGSVRGFGQIVPRGTYRAFVTFYLPGWATNVEVKGYDVLSVGTDGPMRILAVRLDVPRAETRSIDLVFSAPRGHDTIVLLPAGRARPIPIRIDGKVRNDAVRRTIAL